MHENTYTTGNKKVDEIGKIQFTGNIIPQVWYKTIVRDNGKPYLLAITILADIVYWYRPTEIRDEKTGKFLGYAKKFKDKSMLQRSYDQFAEMYGESKRSVTDAIVRLEKLGVIQRVFGTIEVGGMKYNNVLYLDINPAVLYNLTYPEEKMLEEEIETESEVIPLSQKKDTPIPKFSERGHETEIPLFLNLVRGVTLNGETNTKNTTKNTTEITKSSSSAGRKDISRVILSRPEEDEIKEKLGYKNAIKELPTEVVDLIYGELINEGFLLGSEKIITPDIFIELCRNIYQHSANAIRCPSAYVKRCLQNLLQSQALQCQSKPEGGRRKINLFNQFEQNDYDFAQIERELLTNG